MSKNFDELLGTHKFSVLSDNTVYFDIAHGFYIFELIPRVIGNRENVLIMTAGEEPEKQVYNYVRRNKTNVKYQHKQILGDVLDTRGEIVYEQSTEFTPDIVFIYTANALYMEDIKQIASIFYGIPIFVIGDSKNYCVDTEVHRAITQCSYYINETSKVPDYQLEIIYFNKRIRTASLSKLEPMINKNFEVQMVNLDNITVDEILSYEKCVSYYTNPRVMNNDIRMLFGYSQFPMSNEPVILEDNLAIPENKVKIINNNNDIKIFKNGYLYIPAYSEMKVVYSSINQETPGVLYVILQYESYRGFIVEFAVPLDTYFYSDVIGEDVDAIPNANGVKLEYAYVYSPAAMSFKSFDEVLAIFSNTEGVSTIRDNLYQITSFAKKKLTIKTDYPYYLY